MALSTAERTNIVKLTVALFNAAPGASNLSDFATIFEANGRNFNTLALQLANTHTYKSLNPNSQTDAEFITSVLSVYNLQGNQDAREFVLGRLNNPVFNKNKGLITLDVADTINRSTATTGDIFNARTIQTNKADVAENYSVALNGQATDIGTLKAVINNVTVDSASVIAANAANLAAATPVQNLNLTVGQDNLTGTTVADTFTASVAQNALGQQVNTLGSGDRLNGGANNNDTLNATITAGVFAGGLSFSNASMPIQPATTSVEIIKLEAVNSDINTATRANSEVYVNGKDMLGVTSIGSIRSDANLVIQNLSTKDSAGVVRSTGTSNMTVAMEYTGNADSRWSESNTAVYFDQDYLTARPTSNNAIEIRIVNSLELALTPSRPLLSFEGLSFTAGGTLVEVSFPAALRGLTGIAAYNAAVDAVKARLVDLNITGVDVALLPLRPAVFTDDVKSDVTSQVFPLGTKAGDYSPISITSTSVALGLGRVAVDNVTRNFNGLNTQDLLTTNRSELVAINVDLEKAGLAGDGGQLVAGSMNKTAANTWNAVNTTTDTKSGIERFEVKVKGAEDKSSSLSGLLSTNNNLRVVNVTTDSTVTGTSFADLTIGNSKTLGLDVVNKLPLEVLPTSANANALKDVQTFNASAFKGDVKLYAGLTSEVTAKYMNLVDQAPAAAASDNNAFTYTGGVGNDIFNIALDSANLANAGTTTREDFTFSLVGGAGNDNLTLSVVDAATTIAGVTTLGRTASGAANWYQNSKLNANLLIDAGDGDDIISTPGSGDVVILGGAGNDTVYSDNTGAKAVWAFNGTGAIGNLLSDVNNEYSLFKASVSVNFKGLIATAVIPNNATGRSNDLAINQAIKAAINGDVVLNKLLIATDGPANTLVVTSKIDGSMLAPDLVISLVAPAASAISASEYQTLQTAYSTAAVPVTTPAQVDAILAAALTNATVRGDYIRPNPTVDGTIGTGVSDHNITGGAGSDVLVLSTDVNSNEILVYAAGFGSDTIVNFEATGSGIDQLNLSALLGGTGVALINDVAGAGLVVITGAATSRSIILDNLVAPAPTVAGVAGINNNTQDLVANLFQDSGSATAAKTFAYVAVNTATNIGTVYTVSDAVGGTAGATLAINGSNVTAVLQGTIDLADTLWSSLTVTNFFGALATGGSVILNPGLTTVVVPAAGVTGTAAAELFTVNAVAALADVAGTNYQASLTGFNPALDRLEIDLPLANAAITTLAQLNNQQGVTLSFNQNTNSTIVSFGNDANGGQQVVLNLVGVANPATVLISVI